MRDTVTMHAKMTDVVTTNGKAIGKSARYYVQDVCIRCGFSRWVQKGWLADRLRRNAHSGLCRRCADYFARPLHGSKGEKNPSWKGGRSLDGYGYIKLRLQPDDPLYSMAHKGSVREHRYVVATALGRPLERWEVVHHKNGVKADNRLENLELLAGITEHLPHMVEQSQWHSLENRVATLEQRVVLLEAENAVLRSLTAVQ